MSQHDTLTLEPCAFCGKSHTPKIVLASEHWADEYDGYYPHSESYAVMCDASSPNGPGGCGASGGFKATEADAIAVWNRRAALSATQPAQAAQGEPELVQALKETQEACGVTQCPWCGHWGPGYADGDRPSDYCHHEHNLKPWRAFATSPIPPAQPAVAQGAGEVVAWQPLAAAWLRDKAAEQDKINKQYPDHAKCYPSWEKRVRILLSLANDLDKNAPTQPAAGADVRLLDWAVGRWRDEVQNRPLANKNRRSLDDAWRQVVRFAGGDPDTLLGLSHDAAIAASGRQS